MNPEEDFSPVIHRLINADGDPVRDTQAKHFDRAMLASLYEWMVFTRVFDEKAIALQRTGRLGTYASSLGQEAVAVGAADGMQPDDILVPSFREHGAQLRRGIAPESLLLFWGGDERGSSDPNCARDFPVCITVGAHALHAAGAALGLKLRKETAAVLCVLGDGATSKGDFYEALNIAGVWQLPVVFLVNNNQWAISVPVNQQTAAATLAQKSVAAGIRGSRVDGNDVMAVRAVVASELNRARDGDGPALVEALTYRLADHTTVDDASRYRTDDEVSERWQFDPVARVRAHLTRYHEWSGSDEDKMIRRCADTIDAAAEKYLASSPQAPEALFEHLYSRLPDDLKGQRDEVVRRYGG